MEESRNIATITTPSPDILAPWRRHGRMARPRHPQLISVFRGQHWVIDQDRTDDAEVYMRGTQNPDGTIDEHHVVVHGLHADDPISARSHGR